MIYAATIPGLNPSTTYCVSVRANAFFLWTLSQERGATATTLVVQQLLAGYRFTASIFTYCEFPVNSVAAVRFVLLLGS